MRWRCSLLRCLQRGGGWRLQAMRFWRIQQAQTNSAFFKFTALFVRLSMCFVWLWTGPQESKGVYKLVLVASQIFLLTLAQLFCRSLTSRSQVTLSMVTLLLISQWLRHLFCWANASACDYLIISPLLLQLYMLQSDQLLRTECEEEREAWFLFFDWRSSLTTPIEDCTSLYAFMRRFNWQSSLRVYHSNTNTFAGVEQKPHVQTKLDNLLVFQSLFKYRKILGFSESLKQSCLNFLLSGFHAWIFLSQVFYTGATVNLTHDDVVLKSDSVVKSECDKTLEEITRRRVNCLPWLGSLPLRQAEHSSRSCARPNMFALQTSQSKALYSTGFPDASVIPTATRKFTRLRKLTDKSTSLWSMPTLWVHDTAEFIPIPLNMVSDGQNLHLLVRHVLCVSRFMNVLTRYSAEQRHVSQLRGDTSDLVIDDKEVTIFRTSSTGSWRRIRR